MAKIPGNPNGAVFYRQLLNAQYDAYMKVAAQKHGLSTDMLHRKASEMSDEELTAAIAVLRDLAHLPPQ